MWMKLLLRLASHATQHTNNKVDKTSQEQCFFWKTDQSFF